MATRSYLLGQINALTVLRIVSIGAYLEWETQEGILLPIRYLPTEAKEGDTLEVFVYHDNEGRLIATTMRPYAVVGQTAMLECVSNSPAGAFLAWGIHKDLFVPIAEQRNRMDVGKRYAVYLYIDKISGRIVGSAKLNKHIGNRLPDYKPGDEVSAMIIEHNDVGYRCIVDEQHWGIIYDEDMMEQPYRGEVRRAYVRRTRDDGRLDLSLRPIGYDRTSGDMTTLLRLLRTSGGRLPIGDKSSAQEVMKLTGLSKKSFKMAVGALYKQRKIRLEPTSIELIEA